MLGSPGETEDAVDVLGWLGKQTTGRSAAEVRRGLKCPRVKDLNRILYALEKAGNVVKDDSIPPRWTCATSTPSESLPHLVQKINDDQWAKHAPNQVGCSSPNATNWRTSTTSQLINPLEVLATVTTTAAPLQTERSRSIFSNETESVKEVNTTRSLQVEKTTLNGHFTNGTADTNAENPTSKLYKYAQKSGRKLTYDVIDIVETGSPLQRSYTIAVSIDGRRYASASSGGKKVAKHKASQVALDILAQEELRVKTEEVSEREILVELNSYVTKHKLNVAWHELGESTNMPPFRVAAEVNGIVYESGSGPSKKIAKRLAAANVLKSIKHGEVIVERKGIPFADEIASAVHKHFNDLVGAEELMRPGEVLAGFVYVENSTSRCRVVAISHGKISSNHAEHPVYVARRALLKSLYDEVADDHRTFKNSILLQPRPPGCSKSLLQLPNGTDLYLYLSTCDEPNKRGLSWVQDAVLWTTLGIQDECLSCYIKPIRLRGVCVGGGTAREWKELHRIQTKRALEAMEKPMDRMDIPTPVLSEAVNRRPKTSEQSRRSESVNVRVYWSVRDEDLGLEDLEGLDASSGAPSPISFVSMLERANKLYREQAMTAEQRALGEEYRRRCGLIKDAMSTPITTEDMHALMG